MYEVVFGDKSAIFSFSDNWLNDEIGLFDLYNFKNEIWGWEFWGFVHDIWIDVPSKYFALISFTTGLSWEKAKAEKIKQKNKTIF